MGVFVGGLLVDGRTAAAVIVFRVLYASVSRPFWQVRSVFWRRIDKRNIERSGKL